MQDLRKTVSDMAKLTTAPCGQPIPPDPVARLDAVKACGLDCVQLSMDCVGLPYMPDRIDAEVADRARREGAHRDDDT
jgi:hypothetical protein